MEVSTVVEFISNLPIAIKIILGLVAFFGFIAMCVVADGQAHLDD